MLLCFFFKQKTAYEMRISDWSSDVCSSDLAAKRKMRSLGAPGNCKSRCKSVSVLTSGERKSDFNANTVAPRSRKSEATLESRADLPEPGSPRSTVELVSS